MEIAGAAVGETTKSGIVHFERELGYLFHFRRNFHGLISKTDQLMAAQNDVQQLKDIALNNDELIRATVEAWLIRANVVLNEAADLIAEAGPINNWIKGWCTCSRFTLGRKAEKKIVAMNELLADRSTFGDVVSDPKPVRSLALVTAGDFNAFQSREFTTVQVINALTNDAVSLVGVYGMPGVGKTMLIEALSKQVKEKKLFDEVVLVTISQNPDLKTIRSNVAYQLGLKLEETDYDGVSARRLSERLQRDTEVLIVFDDLWERVELAQLGIPLRKNNIGCKVIFTTRIQSLCGKMETDENIEVVVLSEPDSWNLFRQKAGDVVESPNIQAIAINITKECGGLPLALVALGRALRGQNVVVWEDALVQLKKSIYEEHMSPVTSSIMLSFNSLESETTRICFLFCCLFPGHVVIDMEVLLKYVMGENLLEENIGSLTEAQRRLHAIVEKLASSSLLLRGGVKDHQYKMHDVVRDVALSIASTEGYNFMVKAGMKLMKWPLTGLDKCKRLSLMDTEVRCNLPYHIESPLLLSLSLNNLKYLEEIPPDIFTLMRNLLVLDLSNTRIKVLPPSLACLINLRTLCLRRCEHLENVSPVERLGRLEILDLSSSQIEIFPEDMRRLTNLKLLDISDIAFKTIAPKVISSMSKLEELYLSFTFNGWEIKGMNGDGVNASFSEVESLAHLTCLQIIRVAGVEYFSNHTPCFSKNLVKYKIVIANILPYVIRSLDYGLYMRCLVVSFEFQYIVWVPNGLLLLLEKADFLFLHECKVLKSVIQLDPNGFDENLKILRVYDCQEMEYLVNNTVAGTTPKKALSNLEELDFKNMDNLVAMCNGTPPRGFLSKLRVLVMDFCNKISTLIPCDLLSRLQNLEKVNVTRCYEMEKLIQVNAKFRAEEEQICKLPPSPVFPNLNSLEIDECHKLKYLLPMSAVRDLMQLETLRVFSCENIEMIIANKNDDEDQEDRDKYNGILPRLRELSLQFLPKLSSFCPSAIVLNGQCLENLEVYSCESLKNFPWGIAHQILATMNRLEVDDISLDQIEDPTIKQLVVSRRCHPSPEYYK